MLCQCGCGQTAKPRNKYIWGHNWRGRKHSEESKAKMRRVFKGRISVWKGKHLPAETRRKISESLRGEKHFNYGKKASVETRRKMSKSQTGKRHSVETKRKLSLIKTGMKFSSEHRRHISESHKGYKLPEEQKKKISKASKRLWQDPAYVAKVHKGEKLNPNNKELEVLDILQGINQNWVFVGDWKLNIGGKCPDFWNQKYKLIEYFGEYWHQKDDPQERIDYFHKFGFDTMIIWTQDLKHRRELRNKILDFIFR